MTTPLSESGRWWCLLCYDFPRPPVTLEQVLKHQVQRQSFFAAPDGRRRLAVHLLRALVCLHDDLGVVHRQVHPSNVLCLRDPDNEEDYVTFQLANFEDSETVGTWCARTANQPQFRAPELLSTVATEMLCQAHPHSDMWSCGAILAQLPTGRPLLPNMVSEADCSRLHLRGKVNVASTGATLEEHKLLVRLLKPMEAARPTAKNALSSKWCKAKEELETVRRHARQRCRKIQQLDEQDDEVELQHVLASEVASLGSSLPPPKPEPSKFNKSGLLVL